MHGETVKYTASVFRTEIILYFLRIRVHHDAKPSKMAHGDASSSYSVGVPGSNLGLDIECSEGVRAFFSVPTCTCLNSISHETVASSFPVVTNLLFVNDHKILGRDSPIWRPRCGLEKRELVFLTAGRDKGSFCSLNDRDQLWGPLSLLFCRHRGLFLRGYSGRSREVDLSPPSTAEFKNERSCFSASAFAFMASTGTPLLYLLYAIASKVRWIRCRTKKRTLTAFFALRMRSEANAPKNGEPTDGFSFTTMLQHTGRFWSRIS